MAMRAQAHGEEACRRGGASLLGFGAAVAGVNGLCEVMAKTQLDRMAHVGARAATDERRRARNLDAGAPAAREEAACDTDLATRGGHGCEIGRASCRERVSECV